MVTKGYGFTVDDIDWSCPADLEPYEKAYKLQREQQDIQMYTMGIYNNIAFDVVMANFSAALSGKKQSAEYIKKPISELQKENKPLTEEEKQRQVDLFFARENARRANWKRHHKRKED